MVHINLNIKENINKTIDLLCEIKAVPNNKVWKKNAYYKLYKLHN